MKRPSSEFLTHKFEAYEGCTLGELAFSVFFAYGLFVLSMVILFIFGVSKYLCYGACLVGIYPVPKAGIKKLVKIKKGKPHGYFLKSLRLQLAQSMLSGVVRKIPYLNAPYVIREGVWSRVRTLKKEQ